MLCKNKRIVRVATMAELTNPHYYRRLWIAARNIPIGRRKWLDELAACFRDCECTIVYPSGQPFPIPFIDELMGDDPDCRWLGYYLRADPTGTMPSTMSRKLERVQILDLYFRIRYPAYRATFLPVMLFHSGASRF